MVPRQSPISHTPYPQLWEAHAVRGARNSVLSPLILQRKRLSPKLKYEALESSEVGGPMKEKVHIHYSYFWPLRKQGIYPLQLLLGAPLNKK